MYCNRQQEIVTYAYMTTNINHTMTWDAWCDVTISEKFKFDYFAKKEGNGLIFCDIICKLEASRKSLKLHNSTVGLTENDSN